MSKHKSPLPQEIRGIVKYRLEHYHMYKHELSIYLNDELPSNTAQLTHERKARNGVGRGVENSSISLAENAYLREIEKNVNAIEYVLARLTDENKKLVEMVYFRATHTLTGAGIELNMSQRTAYRHADAIIKALALEMGLIPQNR